MSTKVKWEVFSSGEFDLEQEDIEGMSPDEIENYLVETVYIDIHEQGNFSVRLLDLDMAIEEFKNGKG